MSITSLKIDSSTRDLVMQVARQDFGGVSADEAIRRLYWEHWERASIAASHRFAADDPEGFEADAAEMAEWDALAGETLADEPWQE